MLPVAVAAALWGTRSAGVVVRRACAAAAESRASTAAAASARRQPRCRAFRLCGRWLSFLLPGVANGAQISMNAPVMVEVGTETDPLEIAYKELREKKIPFIIR